MKRFISRHHLSCLAVLGFVFATHAWADLVIKDADGGQITSLDMGSTISVDARFVDIRIENTGAVPAGGITGTMEGAAAGDFEMINLSSTTIPASSFVTATVRFAPTAIGGRAAVLRVASTIPLPEDTTLDLAGTGTTNYEPIIEAPGEKPFTIGATSGQYTFGPMTLLYPPDAGQIILPTIASNPDSRYVNVAEGDIVQGIYQGVPHPYRANYQTGPPPLRRVTMVLTYAAGDVDADFSPAGSGGTVAIQPDGKILVAGDNVVRMYPDGTLDPSFTASADGLIVSMHVQRDGKVLVAGLFGSINGVNRTGLARLNHDGSVDRSFNAPADIQTERFAVAPDGKIFVAGDVDTGTVARSGVARLSQDGSLDETFDTGLSNTMWNYSIAIQDDGKVLYGGTYRVGEVSRNFTRFNVDGSTDTSFIGATNSTVSSIVVRHDGKILIGGHFTDVNGQARRKIALLNADGSLDTGFSTDNLITEGAVSSIALQADGKMVIGGTFTSVAGAPRNGVARLDADGALDDTFVPGFAGSTNTSIVIGGDGSVLACEGPAKLLNGPGTSVFAIDGPGRLKWTRTGSVPALASVDFEHSQDGGATWTHLGNGTKTGSDWILDGVTVPTEGHIRANGLALVSNRGFARMSETLLVGRSLTPIEQWRLGHFGSPLNEGVNADSHDFDRDGQRNLVEYGFGLDPKIPNPTGLPVWELAGADYVTSFQKPAAVSGVTYGAEWSTTLEEDDWQPAEDLSSGDAKSFRVVPGSEPRMFFRLKVSNP